MSELTKLLICSLPFVVEVILIMLITGTQEKKGKLNCSVFLGRLEKFWEKLKNISQFNAYQKSRLKGLLIIFIGVVAVISMHSIHAIFVTEKKSVEDAWMLEGMIQMAYMFAAAVAAVYINHGYERNQKEYLNDRGANEEGVCNE